MKIYASDYSWGRQRIATGIWYRCGKKPNHLNKRRSQLNRLKKRCQSNLDSTEPGRNPRSRLIARSDPGSGGPEVGDPEGEEDDRHHTQAAQDKTDDVH